MGKVKRMPALLRVSLRYGFIMGVVGFILVLILYYAGTHPFLIPVFLDYRVVLFTILFAFALKEIRDYYYDGILHFWQGMFTCLIITALFAAISSTGIYFFAKANPEFLTSYIQLSEEQIRAFPSEEIDRIGRDVFESGIEALKRADAYFLATRYLTQSFIISFFISIIISVVLRRQPKTN